MKTKHLLTTWLRLEKQCPYVATEAGFFNSDVIAINKAGHLIEFEIKRSWADFLADFKKSKHELFQGGQPDELKGYYETVNDELQRYEEKRVLQRYIDFIPWKFHFVVTPDLKEKVSDYLKVRNLPYGLYVADDKGVLQLEIKAKVISKKPATERVRTVLALRMSSEIVGLRGKLIKSELPKLESGILATTGNDNLVPDNL